MLIVVQDVNLDGVPGQAERSVFVWQHERQRGLTIIAWAADSLELHGLVPLPGVQEDDLKHHSVTALSASFDGQE